MAEPGYVEITVEAGAGRAGLVASEQAAPRLLDLLARHAPPGSWSARPVAASPGGGPPRVWADEPEVQPVTKPEDPESPGPELPQEDDE